MSLINRFKNYLVSIDYYRGAYYRTIKFLDYCKLNKIDYTKITFEDWSNFIKELQEKNLNNGTINNYMSSIKKLYEFLIKNGECEPVILETIRKFKLLSYEQKEMSYLEAEEMFEIINMATWETRNMEAVKIRAIIYTLFFTGVREQEFLRLKREHFNMEDKEILITSPKGKHTKNFMERKIPILGNYKLLNVDRRLYKNKQRPKYCKIMEAIDMYFKMEAEESNAFNITKDQLEYFVKKLKPYAPKGKNLTIHTFRHSFAMMCSSNGVKMEDCQYMMGHSDIKTTQVYYKPVFKTIKRDFFDKIKRRKKDNDKKG